MERSSSTRLAPRSPPPPRPIRTEEPYDELNLAPRPSAEITTQITSPAPQSARIRKRQSAANVHSVIGTEKPPHFFSASVTSSDKDSALLTPQRAARKGSLRNVVRRIFGRKPKEQQDASVRSPSATHGYHKSDPIIMSPIQEHHPSQDHISEREPQSGRSSPQRTLSAPLHMLDQSDMPKSRSPYAVEFPRSARLKPLDLGNPFHKQQQASHAPRRRATLPSLILGDFEAAALAKAIQAREIDGRPSTPEPFRMDDSDIGLAVTSPGSNRKRRSMSADDLRLLHVGPQPYRDRSEEIRYWRESYTGSILLNNFPSPPTVEADADHAGDERDDSTPLAQPLADPFTSQYPPEHEHEHSESVEDTREDQEPHEQMHDSPILGNSIPADRVSGLSIEDRLRLMEQELASYKAAVHKLTAQTHRQTILIDTSSQRLSRQTIPCPLHHLSGEYGSEEQDRDSKRESTAHKYHRISQSDLPPTRTFTALYNMLSSERSARRALEEQVRGLQQDLAEVKFQLSQPIITRASPVYMPQVQRQQYRVQSQAQNQGQGYSQVQAHAQRQSQGQGYSQHARNLSNTSAANDFHRIENHRLTSRFSRSESLDSEEAAALREEGGLAHDHDRESGARKQGRVEEGAGGEDSEETPHEMYLTPPAGATPAMWGRASFEDDGMF